MSFGHTVDIAAGIQGQVGHVEDSIRIRKGSRAGLRVPLSEYSEPILGRDFTRLRKQDVAMRAVMRFPGTKKDRAFTFEEPGARPALRRLPEEDAIARLSALAETSPRVAVHP